MTAADVKYIVDNLNLDEPAAEALIKIYRDQEIRRVRAGGTRAGGVTPTPEPPGTGERPPAREVHPFWYVTNTWQMLEPTIAWPLGIYQMAKMGLAASAGLPVGAALPRRLGGMSARELWTTARNPKIAQQFQQWYSTPRSQRVSFNRPSTAAAKPPTTGTGRFGVIPPRILGVSSWMPAAGIISAITPQPEPGRTPVRTIAATGGRCPPGYQLTTEGRCAPIQAFQ